jgi:hypothetical protein
MPDNSVKNDIADSKEQRSASINIVDKKYVANFSVSSNKDGEYSYDNYPKIFDSLKDFTDYLDKFFKL